MPLSMSELDPSTGKAEQSVISMKFGQFVSDERKAPKGEEEKGAGRTSLNIVKRAREL